jgi:hypothetical protein
VLSRIFELRGSNRRLENNDELLHNFYFSSHVRVIKSRRREKMVNMNNEGKGPLGRPWSRVVDNIKTTSYAAECNLKLHTGMYVTLYFIIK